MAVDLNKVAEIVAKHEGKKESISIAQIKEVMRIIFNHFSLVSICRIYLTYNPPGKDKKNEQG